MPDLSRLSEHLTRALGSALTETKLTVGELTATVEPARILDVLKHLRDDPDCEFKILVDICGNDWPMRAKRFDMVYHFLSLTRNQRIRIKAMLGEGETMPSCVSLYPAAGWFEREAFDMYGIAFEGNPDLRRIQMPYDWVGYPLRKDYPLRGPALERAPRPSFALKSNVQAGTPPSGKTLEALQEQVKKARQQ